MNPLKPWWLRALPYLAVILAVAGAAAWIDHRGYQRADDAAKLEKAQADSRAREIANKITGAITDAVATVDKNTAATLSRIDVTNRTIIQPTIRKEIEREIRFRDPDAGISDGLFNAINTARNLSGNPAAARELEINLPAVEPVDGPDNRDAGQ
jgi:hypothetical protein